MARTQEKRMAVKPILRGTVSKMPMIGKSATAARRNSSRRSAAPESLRATAYDIIKHEIMTCALAPGEYINEAGLCARLKLGRTPVHQALHRLMLEGLVEIMPRKGVIVKPVSIDEVAQIIEVRMINEPYCARLVAERATDADIAELSAILQRAEEWTRAHNVEQMMLSDQAFHNVLARIAGNAVLGGVLRRLHDRSLRFWFISLNAPGHHQHVQLEHESILAAISKHDPVRAESAMRAHIKSFGANVARYV
jgi:GntR family transcriptional regulator, rspAB operon transcriptional repressor